MYISCCLRTYATNYMNVDITALCCIYQHYSTLLHISILQPSVTYINITALSSIYQHYSPLLHMSTLQPAVANINSTVLSCMYHEYGRLLHISTVQPSVGYINNIKNSRKSGISNNRSRNLLLI